MELQGQLSPNCIFFRKLGLIPSDGLSKVLTNFIPKMKKIGTALFEKKIDKVRSKFHNFEVNFLQIENFSEKSVSFKLKVIFSTNFRPKTKKIVRAVFEKKMKVSIF